MSQEELRQHEIDGAVRFATGNDRLTKCVITTAAAQAAIYLHGAHLTHYQPRGQRPVIFVSRESLFREDKPIRGGVPICFPWFGPKADDPNAPMHGFARVAHWRIESTRKMDERSASVTFAWESSDQTRKL